MISSGYRSLAVCVGLATAAAARPRRNAPAQIAGRFRLWLNKCRAALGRPLG